MAGSSGKKAEEISRLSEKLMFGYESQNAGDLIFDFFDEKIEGISSWDSSMNDFCGGESFGSDGKTEEETEEDEEQGNGSKAESDKAFWDSQEELLLATLRRTTSVESKIRKATKEALSEMNNLPVTDCCLCRRETVAATDGCRECARKQVCDRLQKAGFNCTICKSKWRSTPEIPAGEHVYLEVLSNSQTSGKSDQVIRVIVELNFKSEFKMAKSCEEYDQLINKLPDAFVGKPERLKSLIKILCGASKKCMKDKKMHMAPWRKHKYMQAKWLGKPTHHNHHLHQKQQQSTFILPPVVQFERSTTTTTTTRPKSSMLTFDLLENVPRLNQATMIRVV
ncbi:OLC1v1023955C1 [Oldenlandia corymbosa var. corymbosa]|uniref:OLC1v1023955C1 n=1 Tax=Oldenlandia corymbosa var. corymbosa TaxID=529605 RepID=A0AAV1C151_OLDCO|nr:OLC1v1023955C1 [Oldenlandia corymbosa var. corymbosa]